MGHSATPQAFIESYWVHGTTGPCPGGLQELLWKSVAWGAGNSCSHFFLRSRGRKQVEGMPRSVCLPVDKWGGGMLRTLGLMG